MGLAILLEDQRGERAGQRERLRQIADKRGDHGRVAACRAEFFRSPSVESFREALGAAGPAGFEGRVRSWMERFLYRLAASPHVLKGALMMMVWKVPVSRPTMDLDLLGQIDNEIDVLASVARDICEQQVEPDGMAFDAATVEGARIAEDAEYEGVRVRFRGTLGTARVSMQLDIGFGDAVIRNHMSASGGSLMLRAISR